MNIHQKAKIGVLWIAAQRFCELGAGTKDGTYLERKNIECQNYIQRLEENAEFVQKSCRYWSKSTFRDRIGQLFGKN